MVEENPLDLENIKEIQDEDYDLQQSFTRHPDWYSCKNINDVNNILCYTKLGDNAANWKIVLPKDLILPTIRWYHQVTVHPGSRRLYQHLHQWYYNRDLRRLVDNSKCNCCQRDKLDGKGYGFLPECKVRSIPFEECAVDLVGPWTIQVRGNPYEFEKLTVIDIVTNLVELIRIDDKWSQTVARKFVQCWLTCYLWPQHLCTWPWYWIHRTRISNVVTKFPNQRCVHYCKSPQSNPVCEGKSEKKGPWLGSTTTST
jgi:hypothetical protein